MHKKTKNEIEEGKEYKIMADGCLVVVTIVVIVVFYTTILLALALSIIVLNF